MIRCTQIMLGLVLLVMANHASAQLGPQWVGTWKSEDGHSIKRISASRIDETFDPLGKKDMPEAHEQTLHWTNKPEEKAGPEIDSVFGYSRKPLSLRDISKRYEEALGNYRKDPTDFKVSDPVKSRQAINAIAPGIYKVMWSYGEGDCDFEEHIVDGDKMLVVSECKYGFGVKLFHRVRQPDPGGPLATVERYVGVTVPKDLPKGSYTLVTTISDGKNTKTAQSQSETRSGLHGPRAVVA